ncbi:hypothetical protein TNIN_419651, partial [Trichonephila inaurata madagascariensis]
YWTGGEIGPRGVGPRWAGVDRRTPTAWGVRGPDRGAPVLDEGTWRIGASWNWTDGSWDRGARSGHWIDGKIGPRDSGDAPTMVATGDGESGFDSREGA